MSEGVQQVATWMYRGLWKGLSAYFHVPDQPPTLPGDMGGNANATESFRPDLGFLRYLKLGFWIIGLLIDLGLLVALIAILINKLWLGIALSPVFLIIMTVPGIIAYLAIHLRYDTTWYVMSDRSLRIRRGIWVIHEISITFENIQNVNVKQGPVQRYFGISNIIVETAGGGAGNSHKKGLQIANQGIIEGVANASEIRDRILSHMRLSSTAGLGDEAPGNVTSPRPVWTSAHLEILREIRDEIASLPI